MYRQSGYTLVEVAIVMVIIAVLVAGTIKAQEILNNARVKKTIAQVEGYAGALTTFEEKYAMLPGDISVATNRLSDCDAATFCTNGNADGAIGLTVPLNNTNVNQATAGGDGLETIMFWKHLALADMIAHIIPDADPATPVWGETHPISKSGRGGFDVLTIRWTGWDGPNGHYLRLQNNLTGANPVGGSGTNVMPSRLARMIDEKMDDADVGQGHVIAKFLSGGVLADCQDANLPGGPCVVGCGGTCDSFDCALYIRIR